MTDIIKKNDFDLDEDCITADKCGSGCLSCTSATGVTNNGQMATVNTSVGLERRTKSYQTNKKDQGVV